jgi:hypothetical protein
MPLDHIFSQMNPVHILPLYFFKINFNIILLGYDAVLSYRLLLICWKEMLQVEIYSINHMEPWQNLSPSFSILMMEATSSSKMLVTTYKDYTASLNWNHNPNTKYSFLCMLRCFKKECKTLPTHIMADMTVQQLQELIQMQ